MISTSVTLSPPSLEALRATGYAMRPALEAALLVAAATGDMPEHVVGARARVSRNYTREPREIVNVRLSPGLGAFRARLLGVYTNFSAWADYAAASYAADAGIFLREFSASEQEAFEIALLAKYGT